MLKTQENKYDAVDGKIVNRSTLKPIPDDEPIFIIRAKDVLSVAALDHYRELCADPVHAKCVEIRVKQFLEWQKANTEALTEPDTSIIT